MSFILASSVKHFCVMAPAPSANYICLMQYGCKYMQLDNNLNSLNDYTTGATKHDFCYNLLLFLGLNFEYKYTFENVSIELGLPELSNLDAKTTFDIQSSSSKFYFIVVMYAL